jgi:hypothetical protein
MPRTYPCKSLQERFWSKVNIPDLFLCWEWLGYRDHNGYGELGVNGRTTSAHRLSYTLNIEAIPDGLFVLHKCNNPACVNPYHLYLGSQQDNMNDMVRASRQTIGENHPNAKLTETQVIEIIKLLKTNIKHKVIAEIYSTSEANISLINSGRLWKHLSRLP